MDQKNKVTGKQFPYEINVAPADDILKDFSGYKEDFVQVGPKKYFLNKRYAADGAEVIYNFPLRNDDVFVVSFPKTGTTVTQEMIWLLLNDLNYKAAAAKSLPERFPFLEYNYIIDKEALKEIQEQSRADPVKYKILKNYDRPRWENLKDVDGKRFIKTHLPFSLLPENLIGGDRKIICLARNPMDVAVSYYHHMRLFKLNEYNGDFKTYWYYFRNDRVRYTPYFNHLKEIWERKDDKNVLFMFYEDLIKDFRGHIEKASAFLDVTYSTSQLDQLEEHLKIDNFRKNQSVNGQKLYDIGLWKVNPTESSENTFIRKGKTGGWRKYFDEEMEKDAKKWIEDNLRDTDLRFPEF